jgi:hypothetical protein
VIDKFSLLELIVKFAESAVWVNAAITWRAASGSSNNSRRCRRIRRFATALERYLS